MKRFIVKKYIFASSVASAIRKERDVKPDDCYIDQEWLTELNRQGIMVEGYKYKK